MPTPIVIYLGPSAIDGSPIVVLASTASKNVKTGSMVQTWIMRADLHPSEASARGEDSSICGSCPRRHSLGGDCYVQIVHAPRSVWLAWERAGKLGENWADHTEILRLQADSRAYGLRLGSYGDPMAVPASVWQDLIDALQPRSVVGYTHQWQSTTRSDREYQWFVDHVMASCDTPEEAERARWIGWRYFLAVQPGSSIPERTIQCPATRSRSPLTCDQCGICNGSAKGASKASVFLLEHGMRSIAKAKRAKGLEVLR